MSRGITRLAAPTRPAGPKGLLCAGLLCAADPWFKGCVKNVSALFSLYNRDMASVDGHTNLQVGPFHFKIIDRTNMHKGNVISRNFKIGGDYSDCVNVSIQYDDHSHPISGKIQTIVYDEECSKEVPLTRGEGSITMIKTLLRHIHKMIPEITTFSFDDMSTVECGTDCGKRGSHARPVSLYYLSIAFNGCTWYEKHFRATYRDQASHHAYRSRVDYFLHDEPLPPFQEFLRSANPPAELYSELEALYEKAPHYMDFFSAIPKDRRCVHARTWLVPFIKRGMEGVFSNEGWVIHVLDMSPLQGGALQKTRGARGTCRKTRRRGGYSYPGGRIRHMGIGDDVGGEL